MIEIRYTMTLEEYREANRLWHLHTTFSRKIKFFLFVRFWWAAALVACGAGVWIVMSSLLLAFIGGGLIGLGVVCLFSPLTYRWKTAHAFREMKLPQEAVVTIDDSAVSIARTDGSTEGRMTWSAFDNWAESTVMLVLFPDMRRFVPIPKRAMTEPQQHELRALIAAHLPGNSSPPAAQPAVS